MTFMGGQLHLYFIFIICCWSNIIFVAFFIMLEYFIIYFSYSEITKIVDVIDEDNISETNQPNWKYCAQLETYLHIIMKLSCELSFNRWRFLSFSIVCCFHTCNINSKFFNPKSGFRFDFQELTFWKKIFSNIVKRYREKEYWSLQTN